MSDINEPFNEFIHIYEALVVSGNNVKSKEFTKLVHALSSRLTVSKLIKFKFKCQFLIKYLNDKLLSLIVWIIIMS